MEQSLRPLPVPVKPNSQEDFKSNVKASKRIRESQEEEEEVEDGAVEQVIIQYRDLFACWFI